jgi:hypothetical protein
MLEQMSAIAGFTEAITPKLNRTITYLFPFPMNYEHGTGAPPWQFNPTEFLAGRRW